MMETAVHPLAVECPGRALDIQAPEVRTAFFRIGGQGLWQTKKKTRVSDHDLGQRHTPEVDDLKSRMDAQMMEPTHYYKTCSHERTKIEKDISWME
jgi:hypothetical protein